ncbi:hypothetical protein [Akkermansia massiliensis]
MNNAEIQIQFPAPGQWDKFTLTAVYWDAEWYTHADRYTQDDIPADQAPALTTVVAALVSMGKPWQASQVWARMGKFYVPGDIPLREAETVVLTVEAVHVETGGRRMLFAEDYPEFLIASPAAVAFFKHFTSA